MEIIAEPSEDSEESTPPAKEQRDMDVDADSDGMNVDGPDEPRKKRLRRRPRERDLGDTRKHLVPACTTETEISCFKS
jgi:hypothetical protein